MQMENMAFFYAELALVDYSMLVYSPSVTAAAAVYTARCTLNMSPLWSDILEHHTGLGESQLMYVFFLTWPCFSEIWLFTYIYQT